LSADIAHFATKNEPLDYQISFSSRPALEVVIWNHDIFLCNNGNSIFLSYNKKPFFCYTD